MVITCWSVKGGSGTTVVASAAALVAANEAGWDTLLVDLSGDVPAVIGVDEVPGPGVVDWMVGAVPSGVARVTGADVTVPHSGYTCVRSLADFPDLAGCEQRIDERLSVLKRGNAAVPFQAEWASFLAARMAADGRCVIVDVGTISPDVPAGAASFIGACDRSILVIRPCYLALRRATRTAQRIDGVVLVTEPGRSLGAGDVESVTGAPVIANVRVEPQVARVVDAGLLTSRLPRPLHRAMVDVLGAE